MYRDEFGNEYYYAGLSEGELPPDLQAAREEDAPKIAAFKLWMADPSQPHPSTIAEQPETFPSEARD